MGLHSGGLIIGRIFLSKIWGGGDLFSVLRAYFWRGSMLSEMYGISSRQCVPVTELEVGCLVGTGTRLEL